MAWNSSLPDRKKPMKRTGFARRPSAPMKRSGFLRSKRPKGEFPTYPTKPLKRTPLRKVSKKHARQLTVYYANRAIYLREHPVCAVCLMVFIEHKPAPATEVHHLRGRNGSLLTDQRGFCGTCRPHREWPHENTVLARELGLLASPQAWGISFDRLPE